MVNKLEMPVSGFVPPDQPRPDGLRATDFCQNHAVSLTTRCDRLLTAKELADILAISPKTLYNYVTRGMIPYFKIESNVRFRAREVAEWLRQHSGRPRVLSTQRASGAARK
jgi:excisionase family DNA binding protein